MSPTESVFIRKVWIVVITAIVLQLITTAFGIPERISGMNGKIKELDLTKMSRNDAQTYFNELQTLMASQCSKWDQYMLSNEKDKERILGEIGTIQEDIKVLLGKRSTVTRGVTQQAVSAGGKAVTR